MIWLIVLVAVLVVLPDPAAADPFTTALTTFFINAGIGAKFAATLATFATRMLVGQVLTLAGQLLQKKPKGVNLTGIQTEQTTVGDVTPQKFVVGTYAVEGHAVAPAYSRFSNNNILTYVLEISNVPITGLTGRIAIDGQWTDLTDPDETGQQNMIGLRVAGAERGWLWFYDGTQTAASAHMVEQYGSHPDRPWTPDHVLRGTAYAVLEFWRDPEVFSGLPAVRFEVQGIPLYDPRKDSTVGGSGAHRWGDPATWEYSGNPQVINYNIMRGVTLPTGDVYGGLVEPTDLPLDNWFAGMNECDALIDARKQFVAGFEINTNDTAPVEVVQEMNRASFAQMAEFGGVFRVRVGAPSEAVLSLTDDDFVITEPGSYDPFPSAEQTYTAITGTYVEPADVWQGRAADAIVRADWEAEDGGRRRTMNMPLPAVANKSQAQHLLTAYLADNRRFRTYRMALPPSFAQIEPLDTVSWTSVENGYNEKLFEVISVEDRSDTMIQFVTVRERDSADAGWTAAQDVPQPAAINGLTPPVDAVPVLGIPADQVRSETRVIREAVQNVISIEVTSSRPEEVNRVEVQFQKDGAGPWISLGSGTLGTYELVGPDVGSYQFRARTFGLSEQAGPWTLSTSIATSNSFGSPDTVTGFFAEIMGGVTVLEWEPVANADLSYYRIRHSVETSGATWANATTAIDRVPRPGTSVSLPTRPGTYLIKAVDKTGLSSATAASVVISADEAPSFAQSLSVDEHSGFAGAKTGVEVNSSRLEITDPSTAPATGSYDFAGVIETHDGTVRRVRARVDAATVRSDESAGLFDDMPGLFDEGPGLFDDGGSAAQIADTDVAFWISTTADDPDTSPTWTDYRRFRSGEFYGRGFRFRAVLTSQSANVTPSIGALTAIVEYDT